VSTVLVVDDRALNREFLATLLRYAGHRVVEAADGADALDAARRERPQLVISDVLMPVMDGVAFARALRADPQFADLPVIFYTATYRLDEAQAMAAGCGVCRVLSKPSEPQVILDAVAAALGGDAAPGQGEQTPPATAASTAAPTASIAGLQKHLQQALGRGQRLVGSDGRLQVSPEQLLQAYEAVQSLSLRLAAVLEFGLELAHERDPARLLRMFCGAGQNVIDARQVGICIDLDSRRPWRFALRGLAQEQAEAVEAALEPATGVLGQVFAERRSRRLAAPAGSLTTLGLPEAHPPVDNLLAVPLLTGRGASGWMYLANKIGGGDFSAEDEQFAVTLAAQLAPAFENLMLYDEARQNAERLQSEIVERKFAAARLGESELRFRQLAETINEVFFLVAPARGRLLYLSPAYKRIWGRSRARMYRRLDSWLDDVHPDDRARAERELLLAQTPGEFDSEFRILRPDGAVRWVRARGFPIFGADGGLQRVAGVAEDITERHEHEAGIARLTRIHAVLSQINSAIVRIRDRGELLHEACRIAVEAGVFKLAWVGESEPGAESGRPVSWYGVDPADRLASTRFPLRADGSSAHPAGRALRERRTVVCNDLRSQPPLAELERLGADCGSLAAFPLPVDGVPAAVLVLCAAEPGFFDEQELHLLRELAGDIAFGLQYIEKEENLHYLAFYDALTGLANSRLFLDRLTQFLHTAQPDRERVAVILIDLERFTQINDSLGRQAGDNVLRLVAERLNRALDEPFSVARISADTFAIALAGLRRRADVEQILQEQLLRALELPLAVDGAEVQLSARAGIALYPSDGSDAGTLFKNAEAALKQAQAGGERFLYYARQMNAEVAERLALELRLKRAMEAGQFRLHYQPKILLADSRIVGFEALVRWDDPQRGLIGPAHFIPLLEETGLILELGDWALRTALADHRRWRDAGLDPPRVAVNVSAMQLQRADFVAGVLAAVAESGLEPTALELEVTESLIIQDLEAGTRSLQRLREAGVTVAADDFGTGYSSLRYLAKLPLDTLKIDRSFVITMLEDSSSMAIVAMIISLAHALHLQVIAEGVDDEAQAIALRRMGCDAVQGFLYSRPAEAAAAAKLLDTDQHRLERVRPSVPPRPPGRRLM
jgi:diguanylate cyclase